MKFNFRLLCILSLFLVANIGKAQKRVIVEKFTNAYCGACAGAAVTLKNLVDEHPDVIWLSHHKPVSWTDNGLTNEESIGLWNDLELFGTPLGMVNRVQQHDGQLLLGSSKWQAAVESEEAKPQQLEIRLDGFNFDDNTREIAFDIEVELLSELDEANYQLNIVMVEDSVWGVEQHSYFNDVAGHPLEGLGDVIWGYPHRNVVRHIFDSQWGTDGLFAAGLSSGATVSKNYSYQIPFTSRLSTYHIVAFVSKFDESLSDLTIIDANKFKLSDYGITLNTSEEDDTFEFSLHIAPNPTSYTLTITMDKIAEKVIVIDNNGKGVHQFVPNEKIESVDVSQLYPGLYSLLAIYTSGIVSQPFTIQK